MSGKPLFDNRITRLLGVEIPIANAPMGGVASPDLIAAVAEAGGIGLVPGSLGPAIAHQFSQAIAARTNRPIGANIPIGFADPSVVDTLIADGIRFVTTSAGPVAPFTPRLQAAGIPVLHVVTSLETAQQAADAGVDGLIVEGYEAAGLRGGGEVSMMVLLPLIASRIDLPIIAAGGISDGVSMAAAFALGAEGVQMGTRMLTSAESSIHANAKAAVVAAAETDTMLLDRHMRRPVRVLRTENTEPYEFATEGDAFRTLIRGVGKLYEEGDLESGFVSVGQVSGRIDDVPPVAEIIERTVAEFRETIGTLAARYP